MKFARFDEAGTVLEIFDEDPAGRFHPSLLDGVAEVPDDCAQGWVRLPGGDVGPRPVDVAAERAARLGLVDGRAEAKRLTYITPGSGMALVYKAKEAEARGIIELIEGAEEPDPADFPLAAEKSARETRSLASIATEWAGRGAAWLAVAAVIEGARETAKQALAAAETVEAMNVALQAFETSLAAIPAA